MTLDHDDDKEFSEVEDDSTIFEAGNTDPCFDDEEESQKLPIKLNFCLEYMRKVIDYYDARDSNGRRKHTWKSMQHRFKSVPYRQYLARFRHYIEQDGTKREKLQIINDLVYGKFEEARNAVLPAHDRDLIRWALQKAADDFILTFEASEYWLRAFKHRHHICSRKIAKFVIRHDAENLDDIIVSADSFVADVKREMNQYAPEEILNTDEVGLKLELHST
jgi:hypothetical protein